MAQLTSRCSKQFLVLVLVFFCILKQEFLIVLTVMNGNSAEKKLRQIFRFPRGTFSEKGLICRIFDADQNGLISKDEVRKSLSTFELVSRYIHILIVGHQVLMKTSGGQPCVPSVSSDAKKCT